MSGIFANHNMEVLLKAEPKAIGIVERWGKALLEAQARGELEVTLWTDFEKKIPKSF